MKIYLKKNIFRYSFNITKCFSYIEVDTILQSFIRQHSVDCMLDYFNNQYGQCQIYSLPFIGNCLDFISNRFPFFDIKNSFINVTLLLLFDDVKPFENVSFECVIRALPRLQTVEISRTRRENKNNNKFY